MSIKPIGGILNDFGGVCVKKENGKFYFGFGFPVRYRGDWDECSEGVYNEFIKEDEEYHKNLNSPKPPSVAVSVNRDDFKEALALWEECAQDLKSEIDAQYEGTLDYPTQQRRYKRDVAAAVLSLSRIQGFRATYMGLTFENSNANQKPEG